MSARCVTHEKSVIDSKTAVPIAPQFFLLSKTKIASEDADGRIYRLCGRCSVLRNGVSPKRCLYSSSTKTMTEKITELFCKSVDKCLLFCYNKNDDKCSRCKTTVSERETQRAEKSRKDTETEIYRGKWSIANVLLTYMFEGKVWL